MTKTVLFVDDEPHFTSAVKRALRREPYKILTANSAMEALRIMSEQTVHVVVSDERMPGMSGAEFLTMVRDLHPDTMRIMLTGYATLEAAIRAINEGEIYRFLTKPCQARDLSQVIRQAMACQEALKQSENRDEPQETASDTPLILEQLERHHPGITQLKMDETGAILLDDEDLGLANPGRDNR
ncbi:Response regulator receiver domain-containing protein [Desulfacinum hydrothermale DSM 13146]|uniref:Response regulator receiver domain-containing protein n=1 Tax=Desulfacinum hydrothermale DSM 13146 TaxID=1121390 RepID=A0A1W1XKB4_9BACT|nr:response regulator [Desulfacinum hydrothermale]SMC24257.1 Response regulator receiver domain-containing protein [Desulfacinum hydrothermale DSM 13146]